MSTSGSPLSIVTGSEGFEPPELFTLFCFQDRRIKPLCQLPKVLDGTRTRNLLFHKQGLYQFSYKYSDPRRIRTRNLYVRSVALYPIELRGQIASIGFEPMTSTL